MQHRIRQYGLEAGSLEIEYMEQCIGEFAAPKTAQQILHRLAGRDHLVLISLAPSPEDEDHWIPVAFKVGHELLAAEREDGDEALADLSRRLSGCVGFGRHRVFYSWLGATRQLWRRQGHYRALTEQQEEWALQHGYREFVVKTKNRFFGMRAALDHLQFEVVHFEPDRGDNANSKVYMAKLLSEDLIGHHSTSRLITRA
ncbi:MAG: hypothetical protein ACRD01_10470 [Terriglobales bacterium]